MDESNQKRFDRKKIKVKMLKIIIYKLYRLVKSLISVTKTNQFKTAYEQITYEKALKGITSIRGYINKIISQKTLNSNQTEVLNALFMVDEIFTGEIKSVQANNEGVLEIFIQESDITRQKSAKQPDTTDMLDLESKKSTEQEKRDRLKIVIPNQMLSRLPISLAQLKAENNSDKLRNEIGQLLYSLNRSKKLTKSIYNNLINII